MSSSIEKALALLSMTLEEEDLPFNLPDLPQYSSSEKNFLSVLGRILSPESQKVADLILEMPRKWQLYDRVRGVALSKEIFQLIFKYEQVLEEIIKKWVHTFNKWTLTSGRWYQSPPPDYL